MRLKTMMMALALLLLSLVLGACSAEALSLRLLNRDDLDRPLTFRRVE